MLVYLPVARAEYRSPTGSIQASPVFEPEARILRPASWRAPGGARNGGDPLRFVKRRALRGVLLFGDFLLDKQEKVTCRGSATHKYASPQATQDRLQSRSNPQLAFQAVRSSYQPILSK